MTKDEVAKVFGMEVPTPEKIEASRADTEAFMLLSAIKLTLGGLPEEPALRKQVERSMFAALLTTVLEQGKLIRKLTAKLEAIELKVGN